MSCRTRWTIVARSEQQRRGHVGGIADKITMLEVACSRCDRHGRLSVASAPTQTEGTGRRLSLARITSAGLVQTKGLGSALC